jgi:flagellar basal-body rod protein FlgF
LKLASTQGSDIAKGLDGLFRVTGGGVLPANEDAKVLTGALEGSNVNSSEVLVEMIEAQRMFEMRSKLVSTAKDLDEGSARLMRLE